MKDIKANIELEINKTIKIIKEYEDMSKPVTPDISLGRLTRMDAINSNSVIKAALHQAEKKLTKLKFILTKVGKEDFGNCARCNNPIPVGRILIRPESIYCVKCAGR